MHDITPISTPIHIATVNGKPLRFFRSPVKDPDMPWFAIKDMLECFGLAHVGGIIMSSLKNSEWGGDVRPAATTDGLVEIAPHYMAQGFLGAMEKVGEVQKGALDAYSEAGIPAIKELLATAGIRFGSPEMYAWIKQAAFDGKTDGQAGILDPNIALVLAMEKHGEVVERDGERFIRIAMPEDGADEPPPSPKPSEEMNLDVVFSAMQAALRRAAIADPAAAKDLALDLAEVALLERGRKESDPLRAGPAIKRAVRAMVNLRRRFNGDVPSLGKKDLPEDSEHFKPGVDENTGEEMYWVDEVGIWMLALPRFEETRSFKNNPELTDFRKWFYAWREQVLRSNPPPASA